MAQTRVRAGLLERSVSLQGFYRLTPESADELAGIVDAVGTSIPAR
ncbi:hypothetical protein [Kitasatospora sp. NPDC056181]